MPNTIPVGEYDVLGVTPHNLPFTAKRAFTVKARGGTTDTETSSETAVHSPKRISLTFNNLDQSEDLEMFPVLVKLTPGRIDYADLAGGESGIRFVDADGTTVLPHESENWDANGINYFWVRVPRIDGASATDKIWMYYGDDTLAPPPATQEVWTSNYQAVYHLSHMGEATGRVSPPSYSNTSDMSDGIAHSQHFDGRQKNYIDLGDNLPLLENVAACTLSAFVRPNPIQVDTEAYIIGISVETGGESTIDSRATLYLQDNTVLTVGGRTIHADELQIIPSGTVPVRTGEWNQLVGVIDYAANRLTTYVNGEKAGEGTVQFAQQTTADAPVHTAVLGTQENHSSAYFGGDIDEVRIASTARSGDWIAAQYLTLTDTFITYGTPESVK